MSRGFKYHVSILESGLAHPMFRHIPPAYARQAVEHYVLPPTLLSWRKLPPFNSKDHEECWKPWEFLREFFESKGYFLFQPGGPAGDLSIPMVDNSGCSTSPAQDSFGLYGNREGYKSMFSRIPPILFAARDSQNRDVIIKVVRKGNEGLEEYNVLRLLNSEPLRSHPDNAVATVLEFIEYDDWHFAIIPFYDPCQWPRFANAAEVLDFAEQVLAAISFLHDNHVAHLGISHGNIAMNYHGNVLDHYDDDATFRSTFPVRYILLGFSRSTHFPLLGPGSGLRIDPLRSPRFHTSPESIRVKFDPYAADIYSTARTLYTESHEIVPQIPGLLELLQDMTYFNPSRRISASQALARLRKLKAELLKDPVRRETLHKPHTFGGLCFPMVPVRHWAWLWDSVCLGQFVITWDLIAHYRQELFGELLTKMKTFISTQT